MGIIQTDHCQSCRYSIAAARGGTAIFRFAGGRKPRLFLRSGSNSVREPNAQPAPVTGLFKGFGELPQQAETAVSGIAGNRSFEPLWEQRHCLPVVSGIPDTLGYQEFHVIRRPVRKDFFDWSPQRKIPDYISNTHSTMSLYQPLRFPYFLITWYLR